jgi:heterodisulfide reductase subunit A-like polyferredoxin
MSLALHNYAPPITDVPPAKERIHATVEEVETVQPQLQHKPNESVARNGDKGYYRNEELGGPIHTEREMRVVVIGAGVSGLCFAYKLQRSFENFSLQLYEKNPEISGTWYENRYPG